MASRGRSGGGGGGGIVGFVAGLLIGFFVTAFVFYQNFEDRIPGWHWLMLLFHKVATGS